MVAVNFADDAYVLGELIGAGGMGLVYAAEDAKQHRVAVKVLHPDLVVDLGMVARLVDEALAGRQVTHHNVVRVLDHGTTEDGAPFLVMEYVRGASLRGLIRSGGPLPLSRIRTIASQILSGLAAIHRAGLVHGDMKSDNVLVDPSEGIDSVKIIDFGLSRRPRANPALVGGHMVSGTPEYMAPEMIRGEPITEAADLYGVGVILYEMLTGTTPFAGGTPKRIFEKHLVDDVVPPSCRCPDRRIPMSFERVVLRDLAKEAGARHANAEQFAAAVEHSLPPNCDDTPRASRSVAFSTDAPTRDCTGLDKRRRVFDGPAASIHDHGGTR